MGRREADTVSPSKKEDYDKLASLVLFLCETARKKGVPMQDVPDVAAEAFIDLFLRKEPLPDEPEDRENVISAIVRGRVLDYRKRRARRRARETLVDAPLVAELICDPRDAAKALEERQRIEMIWPQLRPEFREVLSAKTIGESAEETGERLGMKVSTVEAWLFRGRKAARAELALVDAFRKPRKIRTVLVLVGLSSLLAGVRVADAFVSFLGDLFRSGARFFGASLRSLASVAAATGVLAFTQKDPSVVAKEPPKAEVHAEQLGIVEKPAVIASACTPAPMATTSAAVARAKQWSIPAVERKPADRSTSDALLIKAKAALRRGDGQTAISFLDADEAARPGPNEDREALRAAARRAVAHVNR